MERLVHVYRCLSAMESEDVEPVSWSETLMLALSASFDLPPKDRIALILRLKAFLLHDNMSVVMNVFLALVNLTEEQDLKQDVVLSLMKQINVFLSNKRYSIIGCTGVMLELLLNLLSAPYGLPAHQKLIADSGCLDNILCLLLSEDVKSHHLGMIVDILMLSSCYPRHKENSLVIMKVLAPLVVDSLKRWIMDENSPVVFGYELKDLIFLASTVIVGDFECQNIFCHNEGIESIIRALGKNDLMKAHMEIVMFPRKSGMVDSCKTLFTSIVKLLDHAVVKNSEACYTAEILGAVPILRKHLMDAPNDQKGFVISSIVHILQDSENYSNSPPRTLVNNMLKIAVETDFGSMGLSTPVMKYIENNSSDIDHKNQKRMCTPHPNKRLRTNIEQPSKFQTGSAKSSDMPCSGSKAQKNQDTPHPRLYLNKIMKRSPKFQYQISESSGNKSEIKLSSPEIPSSPPALQPRPQICLSPRPLKFKKILVSNAELMVFLNCIKLHGINMRAVRKVWPFHKELTPCDLNYLWRALFKK